MHVNRTQHMQIKTCKDVISYFVSEVEISPFL